jgi:hypothetical protein
MFESWFNNLGVLLGGLSLETILWFIVCAIIIALILFRGTIWRMIRPSKQKATSQATADEPIETSMVNGVMVATPTWKTKCGTGNYKAMVIRGSAVDWTTIPKPVGELSPADPSCPMSGGVYTVRELQQDETIDGKPYKAGEIVDYDPRQVAIRQLSMPEHAYFATHWEELVRMVYGYSKPWYTNASIWFAAAVLFIMFILGLTLGG